MAGSHVTPHDERVRRLREGLVAGRQIVAIVGPTASGKSAVGLSLARLLGGEIVSADSRQVYRHLDIGTAKPTTAERAEVRHHFIDVVDPDQEFNAGMFGEQGRGAIEAIFQRGNVPMVVGGSGLYVRSLIDGLFDGPGADTGFREVMEERVKRGELPLLVEELLAIDPVAARTIDPTKPRRVIRALEVFHSTGRPLSSVKQERKPAIPFEAKQVGLLHEREELYRRINTRVEAMLEAGLVDEVVGLQRRGYSRHLNALNTVGYAEVFSRLAGEITDDEMRRLIQRNSRRYAKRQMTWFSADKRISWFPASSDRLMALVLEHFGMEPLHSSAARHST